MAINRGYGKWLLGAVVLALLAGFTAQAADAPPPRKMNVVLLVLDQLRADQLHCYGNSRETSPNIDRLAERGVRFSHFFTVASWTSPSFASLHTSLYPSRHGVTLLWHPGVPLIDNETPMMAPDFKYHGYYTAAFVNNGLAGRPLTGRGFDEYHQAQPSSHDLNITQRVGVGSDLTAPATTRKILFWLGQHKAQPFFLYVHFMEPHSPYDPPPQDDLFKSGPYANLFDTGYDLAHAPLKRLAMLGDQQAIARLYQLYDGKIHFVDRYVGKILDRLQALGLQKNTLVVLTSDHGELLYSHPRDFLTFDHRSLYDTDLHIPLIIAGPGVPHGRVINALGSNIDTAPTILDMAGLPPLSDAEGRSLVPLLDGTKQSLFHYVYAEEDVDVPLRAVRSLHYKLIRNLWTGKEQLFDLDTDPGELHNIIGKHPPALKELEAHLNEWMKQNEPSHAVQIRRWRIYTATQNVVTVDDMTIGSQFLITGGGWRSNSALKSGNYEGGCFWTSGGNGSQTAIWRSDNPMLGEYKIYVFFGHPAVGRLASNAPFTVVTDSGRKTVNLNFNNGAGEWHLLGSFHDPRYVKLTNAADGAVIADAVKFLRVSPE